MAMGITRFCRMKSIRAKRSLTKKGSEGEPILCKAIKLRIELNINTGQFSASPSARLLLLGHSSELHSIVKIAATIGIRAEAEVAQEQSAQMVFGDEFFLH